MKKDKKKYFIGALIAMMLVGGVFRILCCFWGYPFKLHPDEHTIVNNAIDMLSRNSWEAYVYNRPDQFEIKCNALIFEVVSRLRWHLPAEEVFAYSQGPFYLLGRFFTAMFGIAMIPMTYLLVGKIFQNGSIRHVQWVQILATGFLAFSPIFIQHSAYATPDIVLSFFVLLIAYLSLFYLEKGNQKLIYAIAVLTGICISIKYPAAIMCFYIAWIVIYKCVKEKKGLKPIIVQGISCIGMILGTVFVIAPNLFTDISSAIATFIVEARPNHLGADGLGIFGNLYYYFETIWHSMGVTSLIFFFAGMLYLLLNRKAQHFALMLSGIYWICLSVLSLHWERWGIPMYLAYIFLVAAGGVWLLEQIVTFPKWKKMGQVVVGIILTVLSLNTVVSGIVMTKWSFLPDNRVASMKYCEEQGITTENSLYEGYTPLEPGFRASPRMEEFEIKDGKLELKEGSQMKYYVMSSNFINRYKRSTTSGKEPLEFYEALENTYPLIYEKNGEFFQKSQYEIQNIWYGINYILQEIRPTGENIYIYELKEK